MFRDRGREEELEHCVKFCISVLKSIANSSKHMATSNGTCVPSCVKCIAENGVHYLEEKINETNKNF